MVLYATSSEIHQTCVFYIKKLFIAVLSVLVKRPKNVLKTSQSDDIIIIHNIGVYGIFTVFPDSKCNQTL